VHVIEALVRRSTSVKIKNKSTSIFLILDVYDEVWLFFLSITIIFQKINKDKDKIKDNKENYENIMFHFNRKI
jgi:hypothetical protein